MRGKTVILEPDLYERLKKTKLRGESFSSVIRRSLLPTPAPTGAQLREYYRRGGSKVSEEYLNSVEEAAKHDPIPDDPWA